MQRVRRRIVGQGLNDRAARQFDPVLQDQVEIYIEQLRRAAHANKPGDMSAQCKVLALDVSGELGLDAASTCRPPRLTIGYWTLWRPRSYVSTYTYSSGHQVQRLGESAEAIPVTKTMIDKRLSMEENAKPDLFANISDYKNPEAGAGLNGGGGTVV
ncbi:hypothetical protein PSPO01_10337 [Paraphaeosphaeria sporulosa]